MPAELKACQKLRTMVSGVLTCSDHRVWHSHVINSGYAKVNEAGATLSLPARAE